MVTKIRKPQSTDLAAIKSILIQWTDKPEVEKYIERIEDEINNKVEYNTRFWVFEEADVIYGVGGIADPLPKVMQFSQKKNPGEIKILYVDNNARGKGIGKALLKDLESQCELHGYDEIIIRSARRYEETAYGFYEKMGYTKVGELAGEDNNMAVFYKPVSLKAL